jgi:drug/metabolite transporter (DMT)-like permease
MLVCIPFLFSIQQLKFSDMWMVSFLGVFQIAVAYAFLSFGLVRVLAVEASILSMFEPVLNPVWVYFGYGEVPSTYAIIGGLIIITAIIGRSFIFGAEAINIRMSRKS